MLAEKTFNTELTLPKELQDKTHVLAGELAWTAPEAVQVIDWLEANGREVVGVESWRSTQGKPFFVASSDYSPPINDQVTPRSVTWCAHKARLFAAKFSREPDALFNIAA